MILLVGMLNNTITNQLPSYFVWIDADALILNFEWTFERIIEQFPDYDIIISRDSDVRNGIVNSGCMIMKYSNFTMNFLHDWWYSFNHTDGSDQLAFTKLYHRYQSSATINITSHIAFLPYYVLNSRIPAWKYHQPGDAVLHLAGEANGYRALVFQYIIQQYNSTQSWTLNRTGSREVWWNITREVLFELHVRHLLSDRLESARSWYDRIAEWSNLLAPVGSSVCVDGGSNCPIEGIVVLQQRVHEVNRFRGVLRDILQVDGTAWAAVGGEVGEQLSHTHGRVNELAVRGLRILLSYINDTVAKHPPAAGSLRPEYLSLVQLLLDVSFELTTIVSGMLVVPGSAVNDSIPLADLGKFSTCMCSSIRLYYILRLYRCACNDHCEGHTGPHPRSTQQYLPTVDGDASLLLFQAVRGAVLPASVAVLAARPLTLALGGTGGGSGTGVGSWTGEQSAAAVDRCIRCACCSGGRVVCAWSECVVACVQWRSE